MKTRKIAFSIVILGLMLILTNCKKNEGSSAPGSLNLKAASFKQGQSLKSALTLAGNLTVTKAVVKIQNLVIEENSGNDNNVQQGGNDNQGGSESKNISEKDGGDLTLVGPYTLDITNGTTQIDNVILQAGTYKKVDFKFVQGTMPDAHSIVIEGSVKQNNVMVPFSIVVDASNTVQLPLAGNGLGIISGASSTLSIVFDINSWIKNLDFSTATANNNIINISSTENPVLYSAFIKALFENIDVED